MGGRVTSSSATDDLELALELVDVADAITLGRFRAEDLVVETKPDLTPVSEADRDVEQALRQRLAGVRPHDTVVGEEYGGGDAGPHPPARRWIVDPIDGTKGYVRGMPVWATLLALEQEGEMVVGIVSAPALGRRWWAARGAGAFTTDVSGGEPRAVRVSGIRELGDAALRSGARQTGSTGSWRWPSGAGGRAATGTSGSTCSSPRVRRRSPWTRRCRSGTWPPRW